MKIRPLLCLFCLALQTANAGTDLAKSLSAAVSEPNPFAQGGT